MTLLAAAVTVAAVLCLPARPSAAGRLARLTADRGRPPAPAHPVRRRVLVALPWLGCLALVATLSLPLAAGSAVVVGFAVSRRIRRRASYPELPLVVDLVAACCEAGAGLPVAVGAAAAAAGPELAKELRLVAAGLTAGDPPAAAFARWLGEPDLVAVARTAVRAAESGAAMAAELQRLAARCRADARARVQGRIARASVWVVVPVGLCFLPAFVLVGVVPVAYGLLEQVR